MKEEILTCPFTGCEFTALKDIDGHMYINHPITGNVYKAEYDMLRGCYRVPANLFEHVDCVSLGQAAEILNVTRQRMSAIAANNTIPAKTVNGQTMFIREDVLKYKETRKPGAPKKEA